MGHTKENMNTKPDVVAGRANSLAVWALVTAALGLAAVVIAYWTVVLPVVLGLAAVILGLIARRRAVRSNRTHELATVAICLGAVAILFTPVALMQTSAAEDWGRDCALHPEQDENC